MSNEIEQRLDRMLEQDDIPIDMGPDPGEKYDAVLEDVQAIINALSITCDELRTRRADVEEFVNEEEGNAPVTVFYDADKALDKALEWYQSLHRILHVRQQRERGE